MVLNETQLAVIIQGVRSICDELLDLSEAEPGTYVGDPALTPPPANPPAIPPANPPAIPPANPPAIPPVTDPVVDLDTEGITWDERIHTAKRSKLKSGVWRLKPGVDAVLVAQVKTELALAAQAANPPAAPPGADTPPAAPPGADTPPAPPMTWSDLLYKIVGAEKAPDEVLGACIACGVENIGKLQDKPELIPNVAMALGIQ